MNNMLGNTKMSFIMNILNNYLLVFSRWKDFKGRSGLVELWSFKIIDFLIIGFLYLLAYNNTAFFTSLSKWNTISLWLIYIYSELFSFSQAIS